MNFKATDASIAALGGTCPGSDITARPVTAIKAGPVALTPLGSVDRRMSGGKAVLCNATSISGGHRMVCRKIGNPRAEKVWPHRPRQNKGAAPLTKAPSAFRRIGGAVRQGTLTITGSNVRLGTEMPVALSSFCK